MTITLKRSPYVTGDSLTFKLKVNNEHVVRVALIGEKEVILPKEKSVIQIKQFSGKSNPLPVEDGDLVEIANGSGFRWLVLLLLIYIPSVIILDGPYIIISLFIALVFSLILFLKTDMFKLTKIND